MEKFRMDKPIITIRNLGKSYRIKNRPESELWALRNVSLDIYKGEVWGIIGRNGAGKSTLLKLLSKVTRQSEGDFQIHGKVHSILELGMGFHVELTGVDNLYVAGSLQGMSRQEIRNRLKDIVEFSGLGDAVYQPLRTYSSGMRMRLAFALAAHTDPDILILDEILAVGDEAFQRKCFEVIRIFLQRGVTVLFVSHDMKLISLICNKCLLLQNGRILDSGTTDIVIESYSRIMGPSIEKSNVTLTFAGRYMQLFHKNFRITRRYGLYTAVRANRVWYDPAYILWDSDDIADNRIVLTGHYITVPLSTKWKFWFTDVGDVVWQVYFSAAPDTFIERFQVNVMLNYHFKKWSADGMVESFPNDFIWRTGEDWTRHWIGGPRSVISAFADHERFKGTVQMTSLNTTGIFAVVSSSPEYKAHLLQYLKTWALGESVQTGEHLFFDGRIKVKD
jgi:ABC-type polysaccharide/polyol phosphate transport system ATPase subunit